MRAQRSLLRPVARLLYAGGIVFLLIGVFLSTAGGHASAAGVTVSPRRFILPITGQVPASQDYPSIQFDSGSLPLCQFEAGPVTATGSYHLPAGQSATLQLTYYIVNPQTTETEYIDAGVVTGDGTFTITRDWPGIPVPFSPDLIVEIHFGANLLDVNSGSPVVSQGAGFDYYWYPWVCTPTPQVDTSTATVTETSQANQEATFTPTPTVTETPTLCPSPSITPTPTVTETGQPNVEPTFTLTPTATEQSGQEDTRTPTVTETGQPNVEPTFTLTPTATEQSGEEDTRTPTVTETRKPSRTPTRTERPGGDHTRTPTVTETGQPNVEATFTLTPTVTEQSGEEDTRTPTVTETRKPSRTPTPTETRRPSRTPTRTEQPGGDHTRTPTGTETGQPNVEATFTPTPTNTLAATLTLTLTNTVAPSITPTVTATEVQSGVDDTFTPTVTNTLAPSLTFTPTFTLPPLPSITFTPSPTNTLQATLTFTPTVSATPTVTATRSPTATVTGLPSLNLESVCGYATENQQTWRITNNNPFQVQFLWQATATGETGSITAAANSVTYLTTSGPPQNLRLYVGGILTREVSSAAACLTYLELATACTADNNLAWMVFNNNSTPVNVFWTLDNQQTGSGSLAANSAALITNSSVGAHSLSLSWTYPPLGQRTVTLNTDMNMCVFTATPSVTPTITLTLGPVSPTATVPPQTGVESTFTPTATVQIQPAVESTFTPTTTLLPTLGPPIITGTPVLIPQTGMDFTPAGSLALIGRIFTNLGMLFLGAALLVTGALIRKH